MLLRQAERTQSDSARVQKAVLSLVLADIPIAM